MPTLQVETGVTRSGTLVIAFPGTDVYDIRNYITDARFFPEDLKWFLPTEVPQAGSARGKTVKGPGGIPKVISWSAGEL